MSYHYDPRAEYVRAALVIAGGIIGGFGHGLVAIGFGLVVFGIGLVI